MVIMDIIPVSDGLASVVGEGLLQPLKIRYFTGCFGVNEYLMGVFSRSY